MVETRRKRSRAEENEQEAEHLSETAVLRAVDARREDILHHAASVSTSMLLGWLRQDLGLQSGAAAAALRSHRVAIERRALELLEEQGQVPAAPPPAGLGDLPAELLPAVICWLDHDSLFCALQVSRAWSAAVSQAGLWEHMCRARGWAAPSPAGAAESGHLMAPPPQRQQQQGQQGWPQQQRRQQQQGNQQERSRWQEQPSQQEPQQQQGNQQEEAHPAAPDWRQVYRQRYSAGCYDCFQPTSRHTLMAGSLRVRLCRSCSLGYESPRPVQRLVSATHAKRQCCLKDADLAKLPRCVEPNPANPAFAPMHLFRWLDVRRVAVERWGSWTAVQSEHRRRITRS